MSKNMAIQNATNITHKKKRVFNMSSRQLIHIETDILMQCLNFSITSKTPPNKDIIATVKDEVKDFEKEEADTIDAKINLKLQKSILRLTSTRISGKPGNKIQYDTSVVILPANKDRSKVRIMQTTVHINYLKYILLPKSKTRH